MKSKAILFLSFAVVAGIVISVPNGDVNSLSFGAPANYTGSPGDGQSCITGCHSVNSGNGNLNEQTTVTHNIPMSGYVPGNTYDVSVHMDGVGTERFGFSLSPQNVAGDVLGTLIAGSNSSVNGGGDYITHIYASTAAVDSQTWDFQWMAPQSGTGSVFFYAASLYANNNGNNEGDYEVFAENFANEATNVSIAELDENRMRVYPNPAEDQISVLGIESKELITYQIIDLSSRTIQNGFLTSSDRSIELDKSAVKSGLHLIKLNDSNSERVMKVLIK